MIRNLVGTTSRSLISTGAMVFGLVLVASYSQLASGASISYGDFGPVPPGVSFLDVEESSGIDPVPLFGPPTLFTTGLDFNPTFVASSVGGGADLTDGQLNYTVMSKGAITSLSLFERGDYTLGGVGTAATGVQAGAILLATVREINGVSVAPINLLPVNGSVGFNLLANPGITQPWSLGLGLNVGAQIAGATKIDVVINNALIATSELSGIAFIAKKDFNITVTADDPPGGGIPEPATIVLVLCGASLALGVLRRGRG